MAADGGDWIWLVQDGGALKIGKTSHTDILVEHEQTVLPACDVCEQSCCLDYQNHRKDFVDAFADYPANWGCAAAQLK